MSENLDKSHINEAGKSKSNESEKGLGDAVECSDEALQKKIKSDSSNSRRVQRPHCKQILLWSEEAKLLLFSDGILIRLPCLRGPEQSSNNSITLTAT